MRIETQLAYTLGAMNQRDFGGSFWRAVLGIGVTPTLLLACSNSPTPVPSQTGVGSGGQAAAAAGGGGVGGSANVGPTGGNAGSTTGGQPAGGAADGGVGTNGGGGAGMGGTGGGGGSGGVSAGTGCQSATVCYDFDECKTPAGWTVPAFNTGEGNMGAGSLLVDNAKAHSGTCSLHMRDYSGDQPQHAFLAALPANFGPKLWGRAWVFNSATPTQHGALIKARYAIPNSTDQDWYEVGYEKHIYQGIWHNPLPPSGLPEWVLSSTLTIAVGSWTCVEWFFDSQNGDSPEAADPRIWADGQEAVLGSGYSYDLTNGKGTVRPVHPKGSDFVGIEVGLTMYHPIDEVTNIYLDDLALGKERIGCAP